MKEGGMPEWTIDRHEQKRHTDDMVTGFPAFFFSLFVLFLD